MFLPKEVQKSFKEEIANYEEDKKMPYVTSIERMGIEKGFEQGMQQGMQQGIQQGVQQGIQQGMQQMQNGIFEIGIETVIDILEIRFGVVPLSIIKKIYQIDSINMFRLIRRQALKEDSLESFRESLTTFLS